MSAQQTVFSPVARFKIWIAVSHVRARTLLEEAPGCCPSDRKGRTNGGISQVMRYVISLSADFSPRVQHEVEMHV
jgi:hypothetical protein